AAAQYAAANPPATPQDAPQPAQPTEPPPAPTDQQAATVASPTAIPMAPVPMGPMDTAAPAGPSAPVTPTSPVTAPLEAPTSSYEGQARAAAQKYSLDPDLFVRQLNQESGLQPFNPDGSVKTSPAGARGIAQFMPDTARGMGINPDDPSQ